jgi:subtilisin family serine protease
VAILDTGVHWQHVDLQAGIAVNAAEDVNQNGVFDPGDLDEFDADRDGYVDNVIGWDFVALPPSQLYPGEDGAPPDNDPMDFDGHGTHCAGDAAAVTNNGEGVAGIGWRSEILPVRVGYRANDGQGYIAYSIEGIYYAANHGASVISMSYGGSYHSTTEQAAVDYAAGLGVVLVAAAGNDNSQDFSYPAHYDNVIAVAATDQSRNRADFSNYGSWVDVAAPGVQIYSTTVSGDYGNMGGTSMATPITAGLCALVKSIRPAWTSAEVEEHLKIRCDTLPSFPPEQGGRHINAFRALDIVVRVDSLSIDDVNGNQDGYPDFGEGVDLYVRVHNSFQDVDYVHLLLSSEDVLVTVTDDFSDLGEVAYGEDADNLADPLSFQISEGSGNTTIELTLTVADASGDSLDRDLVFAVGHGEWLIINGDDDDAPDLTCYYSDELQSLGRSFDTWRTSVDGSPVGILNRYEQVIWFTGVRSEGGVTESDGIALGQFLENDGRLFLSGQDLLTIWSSEIPDFVNSYLSASVAEPQILDHILEGVETGVLALSGPVYIFGSGGAGNQFDVDGMTVSGETVAEIVFDPADPSLVAGYSLTEPYRLVMFSFGFEAVNGEYPNAITRSDLMSRVADFFTGIGVGPGRPAPGALRLGSIAPNPFGSTVFFRYSVRRPGFVELKGYNAQGELVASQSTFTEVPGTDVISWAPGPDVAGGVYFFRLESEGDRLFGRAVYLK